MPLCASLTVNDTATTGAVLVFGIPTMVAAGFALDGKPTEERLTEWLKHPQARLEHMEGSGPDDLTLSVLDKRLVFDARRGLIKESQGCSGIHLRRVVNQFTDQMPVDVTTIDDFAKDEAQNRTEYKALPGQCRAMTSKEFEELIRLELPQDITLRHLRRRPLMVAPANNKK
jgi:hypothetical protein